MNRTFDNKSKCGFFWVMTRDKYQCHRYYFSLVDSVLIFYPFIFFLEKI